MLDCLMAQIVAMNINKDQEGFQPAITAPDYLVNDMEPLPFFNTGGCLHQVIQVTILPYSMRMIKFYIAVTVLLKSGGEYISRFL